MITDEKRRKVAAKLRGLEVGEFDDGVRRLANLIDPDGGSYGDE